VINETNIFLDLRMRDFCQNNSEFNRYFYICWTPERFGLYLELNLGIICTTMTCDTMSAYDVAQGEKIRVVLKLNPGALLMLSGADE